MFTNISLDPGPDPTKRDRFPPKSRIRSISGMLNGLNRRRSSDLGLFRCDTACNTFGPQHRRPCRFNCQLKLSLSAEIDSFWNSIQAVRAKTYACVKAYASLRSNHSCSTTDSRPLRAGQGVSRPIGARHRSLLRKGRLPEFAFRYVRA